MSLYTKINKGSDVKSTKFNSLLKIVLKAENCVIFIMKQSLTSLDELINTTESNFINIRFKLNSNKSLNYNCELLCFTGNYFTSYCFHIN